MVVNRFFVAGGNVMSVTDTGFWKELKKVRYSSTVSFLTNRWNWKLSYFQITRGQVKITPQFTCVLDAQNWSVLRLKRNAEQSMVTLHVSRSIIFKGCKQRCITFSDWYMVLPLTSIWQHLKLWWLSGLWTLEAKREYYQNCFIYCQRATSSMGTVNKNSSYSPVGLWVCLFMFF